MPRLSTLDGTPLSALAFGTMQFGGKADEAASSEMYRQCREAGINHFDTARVYTGGRSEALLGRLAARERERVFIATKAAYDGGAGRDNLRRSLDESRRQLGTDVIDLFYMHRFDPHTPLEETFETLAEFRAEGAVRHLGVSNYAAWQVMKAACIAERLGTRIDAIQPMYNLVKRQAEVEILPMAADQGLAVFPYSPLGGGLLTGKYLRGEAGRLKEDPRYAARYGAPWMADVVTKLLEIAAEQGVAPETLAVAWVAGHPAVTAPIISASRPEQLPPALAALNLDMDAALRARLSALGPTPPPATDRSEEA